jgi:hypothetical protein
MVMALAFVLGACSGSTTPATPAAVVPKDKIEVVDGWLRVKQYRLSNQNDSAQAVIGMSEIMVVSKTDSFMVPKADFRSNMKDDYWEIRMGATLKYEGVPKDHGFPVWDAALGSPQNMPACGGAATMCIAAWHGCGPMTCADGKIVGACCGGWSLAAPPK